MKQLLWQKARIINGKRNGYFDLTGAELWVQVGQPEYREGVDYLEVQEPEYAALLTTNIYAPGYKKLIGIRPQHLELLNQFSADVPRIDVINFIQSICPTFRRSGDAKNESR